MDVKKEELSIYEHICKSRFDKLEEAMKAIHDKLFVSNGNRAMVEKIRDNEKAIKRMGEQSISKPSRVKTMLGVVRLQPIESRDIPRIIGAVGILILALDRLKALEPIMAYIAGR